MLSRASSSLFWSSAWFLAIVKTEMYLFNVVNEELNERQSTISLSGVKASLKPVSQCLSCSRWISYIWSIDESPKKQPNRYERWKTLDFVGRTQSFWLFKLLFAKIMASRLKRYWELSSFDSESCKNYLVSCSSLSYVWKKTTSSAMMLVLKRVLPSWSVISP